MEPEKYLDCDGGSLSDLLAVNRVGFILVGLQNTQRCATFIASAFLPVPCGYLLQSAPIILSVLSESSSVTAFSTLTQLPASQIENLTELGYLDMTPVQAESLPAILAGRDVRAQAKTGSGKTAAFGLGVMHRVDASQYVTQALVLCPTRELADQVAKELRRLARFTANIKILTLCGASRSARSVIRWCMPHRLLSARPGVFLTI